MEIDTVRESYLKTTTPEQKLELFEMELKTLEMHQQHSSTNPLKLDELKFKLSMNHINKLVAEKKEAIKNVERQINKN